MAVIGIMTLIVGDLARMFGCIVGLKENISAITFLSIGMGLPGGETTVGEFMLIIVADTFGAYAAAIGERTADGSISHIAGAMAVVVFLGIGISWSIGCIYQAVT
jgi:solute carrier family 8 (sodium/calcium exchanger)